MEDETFVGDTLPNFSDLFIGYEARIQGERPVSCFC